MLYLTSRPEDESLFCGMTWPASYPYTNTPLNGYADLVSVIQGEGPFTVFAPTDAAFQAFGKTLDDLLKPGNKDPLADILKYHVVRGRIAAADLSNGQQAKTLSEGNSTTIDLSGDAPEVNDANIVQRNILTTNGIIHVIDKVIVPPA